MKTQGIVKAAAVQLSPVLGDADGTVAKVIDTIAHAAAQGLSPVYYWLTDAEIVHPPETLARLVAKAVHQRRDLVSLMVKLHCKYTWERLLIPAFVFFFQMLYPFRAANDDQSSIAAAAGGCILVKRETLIAAPALDDGEPNGLHAASIFAVAVAGHDTWANPGLPRAAGPLPDVVLARQ